MIFFLGDVHGCFEHVIDAVSKHRPAAVVFLGDVQAQVPLEHALAQILDMTQVWWIHGNHDTDCPREYCNLFESALADRNLHGRVVEISGLRVAGLGGVFRGEIWAPPADANFHHYSEYQEHLANQRDRFRAGQPGKSQNAEPRFNGRLLKHRSSIFPDVYVELYGQPADILVSHEAPSCHPHGFAEIDVLARSMHVKASFHGHHHDRINYEACWPSLGFQAHGVGFCGITDHYGGLVRIGEFDELRRQRRARVTDACSSREE